ncbi:hypothetical protein [Sphaerisporangium dianthi]|uniref:Uncharacterized protein n=1 Tax=Sphaerisporangium dianthi TaxID=1436120 RepID=A0ABV9CBP7_9ACTN
MQLTMPELVGDPRDAHQARVVSPVEETPEAPRQPDRTPAPDDRAERIDVFDREASSTGIAATSGSADPPALQSHGGRLPLRLMPR